MEKLKGCIKTIGGILIVIMFSLLAVFIWVNEDVMLKLIVTNAVLILFFYVLDKSIIEKNNEEIKELLNKK